MLKMSLFSQQIAIAGRVLEGETDKAISGAMVEIIDMPDKFQTILSLKAQQYGSQWSKMSDRPDRKFTASDGYFYFVNLPPEEYKLKVSVPGSKTQYKNREITVTVKDPIKKDVISIEKLEKVKQIIPTTMTTNIFLLPIGIIGIIKGKITEEVAPNKPISEANVQIENNSEKTLSDQKGNYVLLLKDSSKSDPRTLTLIVSATDYEQKVSQIEIQPREVISYQNFSLKKIKKVNNN